MNEPDPWICQCRRCHGVHDGADAVQYVWEYSFGACDVPVVVAVNVAASGHVWCAEVLWHGDPAEPRALTGDRHYLVSFRPGGRAVPTEGDLATWRRWRDRSGAPLEWLIADGTSFRSVGAVCDALEQGEAMPSCSAIAGDWDESLDDPALREEYRATWAETVQRNQAERRA